MAKHFQQTPFWADFKCAHGWKNIVLDDVSVLLRTFRLGPVKASLAYVPLAPEAKSEGVPSASVQMYYLKNLGAFAQKLRPQLPKNTLCIRFDLPQEYDTVEIRDTEKSGMSDTAKLTGVNLVKSDVDIQPPDSVILDLSLSEDELLAQMKSKWRYNIRYASKHGVSVRAVKATDPEFEKDLDSFYQIYQTTASRDGIGLHPKSYYKDLLERGASGKDQVTLFIASHEGQDLAGIITLFTDEEGIYLYGASSNEKRNLMPNYLIQWTAIQAAKNYGCKIYDFYGIPPTSDQGHPMHGLYLFKTGFGGKEIHRPGCYDYPLGKMYGLYIFAEKARAFWHKRVMKVIRGR